MTDIKKIAGFTGTQKGMTDAQKAKLAYELSIFRPREFHHGDCVGADSEAHDIVRRILPDCKIVIHPPTDSKKRAYKKGDVILDPLPYLERNHRIVEMTRCLVACPAESNEVLRSGTWSTIRYAGRKNKTQYIILPDGSFAY